MSENHVMKGFVKKTVKCVAIAAVFGLVSGTAFTGVQHVWNMTENVTEEDKTEAADSKASDSTTFTSASSDQAVDSTDTSEAATSVTDVSGVVENVMPSIVAITNISEQEYQSMFGQGQGQTYQSESCGSGIIVSQDEEYLYITTNNHVVEGATTLTVQFADDTTAEATVKGTDATHDLAVVEVAVSDIQSDTISNIRVATLGDSDSITVGESAIAIGNALGYGQSVTTGVISALNREVSIQDETTGQTVSNSLIQTDAAINPGNSGGALLNLNGEVIGINSSKYSDTSVEGMGFAIPINTAKDIISSIIDGTQQEKSANAGYLGVSGIDVSAEIATSYNMPEGVYIAKIAEGSAAEAAGLMQGQIIIKVDDTAITSASQLAEVISGYEAGAEISITVQTNNGGSYVESQVSATLGSQADKQTS